MEKFLGEHPEAIRECGETLGSDSGGAGFEPRGHVGDDAGEACVGKVQGPRAGAIAQH